MDTLKSLDKPFEISKRQVWIAWEKVRENKGAPGVDGVTIEEFEKDVVYDRLPRIRGAATGVPTQRSWQIINVPPRILSAGPASPGTRQIRHPCEGRSPAAGRCEHRKNQVR